MPLPFAQRTRELSVRRKLNAMEAVFKDKNVLLVDDSIVRGTTMAQIVGMVRSAGAKKVRLGCNSPSCGDARSLVCGLYVFLCAIIHKCVLYHLVVYASRALFLSLPLCMHARVTANPQSAMKRRAEQGINPRIPALTGMEGIG